MTAVLPPLPEDIVIGIVQGQTYGLTVTWTDGADPTPNPLPMTGRYAHFTVRTKRGVTTGTPLIDSYSDHVTQGADQPTPDDLRIATATVPDITQEPSGDTGKVVVRLPATATAILSKESSEANPVYYFDLFTVSKTDPTDAVLLCGGIVATQLSSVQTLTAEPV